MNTNSQNGIEKMLKYNLLIILIKGILVVQRGDSLVECSRELIIQNWILFCCSIHILRLNTSQDS